MFKYYKLLFLLLFTVFMVTGSFAQNCFFIERSSSQPAGNESLVTWLEAEGYTVTRADVSTNTDLGSIYFFDEIEENDFVFISETVNSGNMGALAQADRSGEGLDYTGVNIPIISLELFAAKQSVWGWVPQDLAGTYYENSDVPTVKILDGSHPLAAGFTTDTEVTMATATVDAHYLNWSNPTINHIPIAETTESTPSAPQLVIFGIEKGTWLNQAVNTDPDGSWVTNDKIAAVGISEQANTYISDDGFKLIKAAIDWILEDTTGTAINSESIMSPNSYELNQNYPNPFNPNTHISYTLEKGGFVNLTVYDVTGREVAILVNGNSAAGKNMVNFDASNLNSGVYFYTLTAGNYTETKKMMLIK